MALPSPSRSRARSLAHSLASALSFSLSPRQLGNRRCTQPPCTVSPARCWLKGMPIPHCLPQLHNEWHPNQHARRAPGAPEDSPRVTGPQSMRDKAVKHALKALMTCTVGGHLAMTVLAALSPKRATLMESRGYPLKRRASARMRNLPLASS